MDLDTSAGLIACAGGGLGAVAVWRFRQTTVSTATTDMPAALPISNATNPASAAQLAIQENSNRETLIEDGE